MITARHYPRSKADLIAVVVQALSGCQTVAAQAGHFLLFHDQTEFKALPCVASELLDPCHAALAQDMGQFPGLSWRLAHSVLAGLPARERCLLVLVNDWQYIPDKRARDQFYQEYVRLPDAYIGIGGEMDASEISLLTPRGVARFTATNPFFSERVLRNKFHKRLKKLSGSGALPQGIEVSVSAEGTTCSLAEIMGEKREIYCSSKSADCAGEVAELIDEVHTLVGCDAFINFFPGVCRQFVEVGSEIADKVFRTGVKNVINIALPATGIQDERQLLQEAQLTVHAF